MRAGEPPTVDMGPVARALLDPLLLVEAQVTAKVRLVTSAVDTQKVVLAQRAAGDAAAFEAQVVELALQAVFAAVGARARQASCPLYDAIGPSLRAELESEITRRMTKALAGIGLGVARLEGLNLTMDPKTVSWLRSRRSSPGAAPAPPTPPPDEATELAPSQCGACGTDVRPGSRFCVSCGAPVAQPGARAARRCASCGAENAPDAKFCGSCGARTP